MERILVEDVSFLSPKQSSEVNTIPTMGNKAKGHLKSIRRKNWGIYFHQTHWILWILLRWQFFGTFTILKIPLSGTIFSQILRYSSAIDLSILISPDWSPWGIWEVWASLFDSISSPFSSWWNSDCSVRNSYSGNILRRKHARSFIWWPNCLRTYLISSFSSTSTPCFPITTTTSGWEQCTSASSSSSQHAISRGGLRSFPWPISRRGSSRCRRFSQ